MASTKAEFSQVFLTYADVIEAHPDWSPKAVEDYMATKRDLVGVADLTDESIQGIEDNTQAISGNVADINRLRAVNDEQSRQITELIGLVEDGRQNISGLLADNGRLRTNIESLTGRVEDNEQLLS